MTNRPVLSPLQTGFITFVLALAGLAVGWWWVTVAAGLVAGFLTRPGGRAFLPAFLGSLLAWVALDIWRLALWQGAAQLWQVTALAGLPAAAGPVFMDLPALLAAVAAGFASAAVVGLLAAAGRPAAAAGGHGVPGKGA